MSEVMTEEAVTWEERGNRPQNRVGSIATIA